MDTNTKRATTSSIAAANSGSTEEEVRHAWMKGLEEALQIDWTRREPNATPATTTSSSSSAPPLQGVRQVRSSSRRPMVVSEIHPAWLLSKGWMRRTTSVLPSTAIMWALG